MTRTIESWNKLLSDDPRSADAWAAETVMGWEWCDFPSLNQFWLQPPDECAKYNPEHRRRPRPERVGNSDARAEGIGVIPRFVPYYTTDPTAAEQVRQRAAKLPRTLFVGYVNALEELTDRREPGDEGGMSAFVKHHQSSDYVGAFWLLDADEELRQLKQ